LPAALLQHQLHAQAAAMTASLAQLIIAQTRQALYAFII